jgi:hypothetical protein
MADGVREPTEQGDPMPEPPKIRLIPRWRTELTRLWSMRVAYFWMAMGAVAALWMGLAGSIPTPIFFGVGFLVIFSFSVARFLKQPGTDA